MQVVYLSQVTFSGGNSNYDQLQASKVHRDRLASQAFQDRQVIQADQVCQASRVRRVKTVIQAVPAVSVSQVLQVLLAIQDHRALGHQIEVSPLLGIHKQQKFHSVRKDRRCYGVVIHCYMCKATGAPADKILVNFFFFFLN